MYFQRSTTTILRFQLCILMKSMHWELSFTAKHLMEFMHWKLSFIVEQSYYFFAIPFNMFLIWIGLVFAHFNFNH